MKSWRYKGVLLLIVSCLILISIGGCLFRVEKVSYEVIRKESPFQVRLYDSYLVAETLVDSTMEDAGNKAFRRLFRYITGENHSKDKIEMTAPVSQNAAPEKIAMTAPVEQTQAGKSWKVAFAMPAKYTMNTIPNPNDARVTVREIKSHHAVSIKYSGDWSESRYTQHLEKLRDWMEAKGMSEAGQPVWARYNPPLMPSFLRRNEIMIPIDSPGN